MRVNDITEYFIHGGRELMSYNFNVLLTNDKNLYSIVFSINDLDRLRIVCRLYRYYSEPYREFEVNNIKDSFWENHIKITYSPKDKLIMVADVDDDEYEYLEELPTTKRISATLDDFIEYAKIPKTIFRRK